MTDDKFYTSLSANNILAKLTNHVQRTRLITPSTDEHYSPDSEDDFRSGCRKVSYQQQFSRNLNLQEAFETAAQINETLKRTEFDGAFCKKFKILVDRFSLSFR